MRGVFLDVGSLTRADIDLNPLGATAVQWAYYDHTVQEAVKARIADAEIVVTNKVMVDAAALAAAGRLRLICIAATGTNNVDLAAARQRGVTVCNVRGYATASVVEHVFALMLALMRRLPDYQRAVREGRWQRSLHFSFIDFPIGELHGRTLGIVGYGELGHAVAAVAAAFGMRVLIAERAGAAPRAGRVPLAVLLAESDVVSLHAPLTPVTRNLIGARQLKAMKRGALLINTARGGMVDEAALAAALREGRLGGAAVDVLTHEPPADNPLLADDIPNLIVTPHIAWASREARQRLLNEVAENVRAFIEGRPRNVIG
jgi:glycerate dehydrogenase